MCIYALETWGLVNKPEIIKESIKNGWCNIDKKQAWWYGQGNRQWVQASYKTIKNKKLSWAGHIMKISWQMGNQCNGVAGNPEITDVKENKEPGGEIKLEHQPQLAGVH